MARKRWTRQTDISPALNKLREKRKWQITLRRYIIQKNPSHSYAPYFGLDISSFRKWIEIQLEDGMGWEDFGKRWQFDHIVPISCFDISLDEDLRLCWHFTNIAVAKIIPGKEKVNKTDLQKAKTYFEAFARTPGLVICTKMLEKIKQIELSALINADKQTVFLQENKDYLQAIQHYNAYEFELLNSGRSVEEVKKEAEFLKKLGN